MTTSQLLEHLDNAEAEYAGPESRLDDYMTLSAAVLEDGQLEASKPSLFASCGCTPQSPQCAC
jgi:hypothetical protein